MSPSTWWRRLAHLADRRRWERELQDEMQLHMELRAERLRAEGAAHDEAAQAARRQFGNTAYLAASARSAWGWDWLDGPLAHRVSVMRQLRAWLLFALVAIVTLAMGIGINTAAFTIYDAVVLKPIAVRAPDDIVRIVEPADRGNVTELSYPDFALIR